MSTQTEAYGSFAVQTRRFACDRCHKHKLRCERAPILAHGNPTLLSLGTCKRCEKAGAECRTTTTATSAGNTGGNDRTVKRKSPPIEVENTDSDPAYSASLHLTTENDLAMFSQSPGEALMFNTDGAVMLDLGTLEGEIGDFYNLETMAAPAAPSIHFQYPGDIMCQPRSHEGGAKSSIDATYEASESSAAGSTSSNALPAHSHSYSHSHQDERKRLLDFHTLVFDGLHHITDGDLANSLFASDTMTPASRNADTPPSDIIGRVLATSERLIELLDIFGKELSSESTSRPRGNSGSQRTLPSISPTRYKNSSPGQPNSNFLRRHRYSLPDNLAKRGVECDRLTVCSVSLSCTVGLPVVLSFLTSYVGLLSVYRTIFSYIQEMVRTLDTLPSASTGRSGPQSKRALLSQAEGNTLNHEQILRIRIQLEVMAHMLDRIRLAWADFMTDSRGNENGADCESSPCNKAAAMLLLQSMLMHECFDCRGEGFEIGLGSLEVTLESIRTMLRGERVSR